MNAAEQVTVDREGRMKTAKQKTIGLCVPAGVSAIHNGVMKLPSHISTVKLIHHFSERDDDDIAPSSFDILSGADTSSGSFGSAFDASEPVLIFLSSLAFDLINIFLSKSKARIRCISVNSTDISSDRNSIK